MKKKLFLQFKKYNVNMYDFLRFSEHVSDLKFVATTH